MKIFRQRGKSLFAISWLLTRLWFGLELSKLMLFRIREKAIYRRVNHFSKLNQVHWVVDRKTLYCLRSQQPEGQITITALPIENN